MRTNLQLAALIIIFSVLSFSQPVRDLIEPIRIQAGTTDTIVINDLFYAEQYNLEFTPHNVLDISYSNQSGLLVIDAPEQFSGMTLLEFTLEGKTYQIPVISVVPTNIWDKKKHSFTYTPSEKIEKVTVAGSFNDWKKDDIQLLDADGDGTYEVEVSLAPGTYVYKLYVDGEEILDPANEEKVPTGFDDFNSLLTIADPVIDEQYLHILNYDDMEGAPEYHFYYQGMPDAVPLENNEVIALLDNQTVTKTDIAVKDNMITVSLGGYDLNGKRVLRVAVSKEREASNIQQILLIDGSPAGNSTTTWYDGIIYSIMIDRFNDGDPALNNPIQHDSLFNQANYQGGDLQGIIDKIDEGYFDDLGINILWISPVYDAPNEAFREYPAPHRWYSGYHGYWPIHHQRIEEKFGDMDKLKELIAKAHEHDIKVLLDFVANHTHIDHPFYKEHPEWFGKLELPDGRLNLRFWDEFRLTTWFEPYMPSFDYTGSNEAVEVMTDNAVWWLKETGADGFRHDAVKHVPFKFWRALMSKIKKEIEVPNNVKVYQIGETFGDYKLVSDYVNNGQLSAQFNFNLSYFGIPIFIEKDKSFAVLDNHMKKTFFHHGVNHLMGNIMDSHDKIRFMAFADGDIDVRGGDAREIGWNNPPMVDNPASYEIAKLFYAYMFTIPGLPVVYYGSEFGMTGADDPDNRRFMRFDDDLNSHEKQMLKDVSEIITMRNEHSALRYGDFLTLIANTTFYAYMRSDMNEHLLVILNKHTTEETAEINLPEIFTMFNNAVDVQTGEEFTIDSNRLNVPVKGIHWRVLKLN